jgi:glycosyltransferase involved in cell wall biosynthesis
VTQLSLAGKVTFKSGLPDDEYAALLASAEIAVVASMYEGFSLPAVEHMASGTPLIATRAGALPEVTGDAALQVSPGDPEELAAALRRLHDSPAERDARSLKGLDRVTERYAWPAVAEATATLYRHVINGEITC